MFKARQKVRMHDTDMAGILYFPRQFRFIHDTFEDLMEKEGFSFEKLFQQMNFIFVVVHAEADYIAPMTVGDHLEVRTYVSNIGTSSFTFSYEIYKLETMTLAGKGKTVHCTLNMQTRTKIPIPDELRKILQKYEL